MCHCGNKGVERTRNKSAHDSSKGIAVILTVAAKAVAGLEKQYYEQQ